MTDIDQLNAVEDFSPQTLLVLSQRIARSSTPEQLIYREGEIDEVWRLLSGAMREAELAGEHDTMHQLRALQDVVMTAHDLIGVDSDPAAAADLLRQHLES